MSSTYACQSCCGDFAVDKFITPSMSGAQVGQTVQMHAFELRSDCYGWEYPVEQSASWSSSNEEAATVSDNEVTFVGAGQTTISASWNSPFSVSTQCSGGPGFLPGPEPIGPITCCDNDFHPSGESVNVTVAKVPNIKSISQMIIEESQQGDEVVECGRFKITIKYDVSCPPVEPGIEVIGNIQTDAVFLCNEAHLLLNNDGNEVCTYEIRKIYRMKNRLSQTVGTGFTSYSVKITDNGRVAQKQGPGVSVRARIPGTAPCQGVVPCP